MKKLFTSFFFIGILLFSKFIVADSAPSLYQATVPVASQSQSDWQAGISTALAQVLVKVSGSDKVLNIQKIKSQLAQPASYVQSFTYVTNPPDNSAPKNNPTAQTNNLMLQAQFYPQAVKQLLQNAGATISVTPQKPTTLVWLVTQTPQGQTISSSSATDNITTLLQTTATNRGLPILLPIMDLQDMQNVGVHDVWQLDPTGVITATKRYGAKNILEAKIYMTSDQQWHAQWLLLVNDQNTPGNAQGNNANQIITAMLNKVANDISAQNAKNNSGATQQVTLHVSNVNGLDDYAAIVNYLRGLTIVSDVQSADINSDNLTLNVTVSGGTQALIDALNESTQMQPVPTPVAVTGDAQLLNYRWNSQAQNTASNNPTTAAANTSANNITNNNDDDAINP